MSDTLRLLLFLGGYVVLMKWLLPWLGVPTCMSGSCNVATHRNRETTKKPEEASDTIVHPTPER